MATIKDFKINQNGSMDLSQLVEDIDCVVQMLWIRLGMFRGDWFYNNEAFIDFTLILQNVPPREQEFYAQVRETILDTFGVTQIESFTPSIDYSTRKLTLSFKANSIFGPIDIQNVEIPL